ncbi:MAG: hypothetical protein GVY29_13655 [Spirochaetes bacterium]|nr:hypothetical protein [Spirochaetota bacterium]
MRKGDLTRSRKTYFSAKRKPQILELTGAMYAMVDGSGDPIDSDAFELKTQVLHNLVLRILSSVMDVGRGFEIPPLEAIWWTDDPQDFSFENRDLWKWTALIMVPDQVTRDDFDRVRSNMSQGKSDDILSAVRLGSLEEGIVAQMLHVGPYSEEGRTVKALEEFIASKGYQSRGKHHEIYLGNPRRVAPERLRTIIRRPVEQAQQ